MSSIRSSQYCDKVEKAIIKKWVDIAGKEYSSLNEILSSQDAMNVMFQNENANDYLCTDETLLLALFNDNRSLSSMYDNAIYVEAAFAKDKDYVAAVARKANSYKYYSLSVTTQNQFPYGNPPSKILCISANGGYSGYPLRIYGHCIEPELVSGTTTSTPSTTVDMRFGQVHHSQCCWTDGLIIN